MTKTINYTYNGAGLGVRRVDTSTNVTKLWTYAGNNIASVQTSAGGSYGADDYVYTVGPGMINNVTERHLHTDTGAESWYYQYDHRGNVVAVTDYSGKILRGYQYDAFGNIPFSFATGQSGAAPTDDILFTGKDLDPDTGLYYFNARWYDPEAGEFMSRSRFPRPTEAPYSISQGEPLSFSDPTGMLRTQHRRPGESRECCVDSCYHSTGLPSFIVGGAASTGIGVGGALMNAAGRQGMAMVVGSTTEVGFGAMATQAGIAADGAMIGWGGAFAAPIEFMIVYCNTLCLFSDGFQMPPPPPPMTPRDCIKQCERFSAGSREFSACFKGCKNSNPGRVWPTADVLY